MLIGIVAGEASGDILGAGLVRSLQQRFPQARFVGVAGPRMLASGVQTITPMERLSVMGFVEPLGRLPELLRLKRDLLNLYRRERPAVVIGIDSPGFNLRLESELKAVGIPTVHYVSPSVWAWGARRIYKIARSVDLMLTLFPFETEIYEKHSVPSCCVGHPLADALDPDADQDAIKQQQRSQLGIPQAASRVLCVMPGSRGSEVERLAPVFLQTAVAMLQKHTDMFFVIPAANPERLQQLHLILQQTIQGNSELAARFKLLDGSSHQAMQASDAVLLASGTATLEAMLLQRPMVVAYKLAPLTWMLASRMLRVPYVSLPNLLAGQALVPEFLQHAVTPIALEQALNKVLDTRQRQVLSQHFRDIHRQLRLDANERAATAIESLIHKHQS